MPRTISTNLKNSLSDSTVNLAVLVLITRLDGQVFAFTSWDVEISYGGNTYLPAISMNPSSVKVNADLTTDQMDIIGAIDSVLITEDDIDAGRYDQAAVQVMRINPFNTSWGVIIDLTGNLGDISYGDGKFQANVDSLGQKFSQQIGDIITPVCRVRQLGDAQCKVNIAAFQFAKTISANAGDNLTLSFADTVNPTGYFDFGMLRFKSIGAGGGLNHDINMEVKTSISNGDTIVTLNGSPTGGTFNLIVIIGSSVLETTNIAYNALASTVQTALEVAVGIGNMTVSGSAGGPYTISPAGSLVGVPLSIEGDGTLLTGGTTTGISSDVSITTTGGTVMTVFLQEPMPFLVSIGDAFIAEAGCDRRAVTCRAKFNNLVNFHGEPYVPGNDYLLITARPPS